MRVVDIDRISRPSGGARAAAGTELLAADEAWAVHVRARSIDGAWDVDDAADLAAGIRWQLVARPTSLAELDRHVARHREAGGPSALRLCPGPREHDYPLESWVLSPLPEYCASNAIAIFVDAGDWPVRYPWVDIVRLAREHPDLVVVALAAPLRGPTPPRALDAVPNLILETSAAVPEGAEELAALVRSAGAHRLAYGSGDQALPASSVAAWLPEAAVADVLAGNADLIGRGAWGGVPLMGRPRLVVLDALLGDLDVERSVAAACGWDLSLWDGHAADLEGATAVVHVRTAVDRAVIERMPSVRVIGRYGTGLDTVDLAAARELGIEVVAVRDYCVPELTSHTLGLAFALDRGIAAAACGRLGRADGWLEVSKSHPIAGRSTATVIGFGTIGRAVARALLACGLAVRVVTAHGADEARSVGATPVTLDEGLGEAGFVFLHSALSEETAGLIDAERIARMAQGAILIDTARIGLIDEAAVAAALAAGHLGGVGLDARLTPGSPLRDRRDDDRLIVTPHIGWYSERSAHELRRRTIEDTIAAAERR